MTTHSGQVSQPVSLRLKSRLCNSHADGLPSSVLDFVTTIYISLFLPELCLILIEEKKVKKKKKLIYSKKKNHTLVCRDCVLEEEQVGGRDYNRKETNKASYNVNLICLIPENDVSCSYTAIGLPLLSNLRKIRNKIESEMYKYVNFM